MRGQTKQVRNIKTKAQNETVSVATVFLLDMSFGEYNDIFLLLEHLKQDSVSAIGLPPLPYRASPHSKARAI